MGYPKGTRELNRDAWDMGIGLTRQFTGIGIKTKIRFSVWEACSDRSHEMDVERTKLVSVYETH